MFFLRGLLLATMLLILVIGVAAADDPDLITVDGVTAEVYDEGDSVRIVIGDTEWRWVAGNRGDMMLGPTAGDAELPMKVLEEWEAQNQPHRDRRPDLNVGRVLFGLVFIGIGALGVFKPMWSWYLSYGWMYRNVEPSDAALVVIRITGVIAVIIGIFLIAQ